MIPVYTALILASMSLPITFQPALAPPATQLSHDLRHDLAGVGGRALERGLGPELDLPDVERLEIVIPLPERDFDDSLPNFIEQPTPVLEIMAPELEPSTLRPPRRAHALPAATMSP